MAIANSYASPRRVMTVLLLLGLSFADCGNASAGEQTAKNISPQQREFFEQKIRPVLVQHCYKCHSAKAKEVKGNLLLDTRQGLLRGGDSGPSVLPGQPQESLLLEAIRYESFEMPPDAKLPDHVVKDFAKWIAMGAPDPRHEKLPVVEKQLTQRPKLWSLEKIRLPDVPRVVSRRWPQNDIDRYILARMEQVGLAAVADSEPERLLRRIYFDLIGLPPTIEQLETFLNAIRTDRHDAVRTVIDELLASPHFGERWGRHWLDIARYGESNGMAWNMTLPYAWRYRDYVIKSFNEDKPFDRFVTEQIAGDLLPAETDEHRYEQLTATGFLALGSKPFYEKPREIEQNRPDWVDEQLNVIGKGLLGLTVSCARCHDHKFDPIPTRDYYALAGIFFSTEILSGPKVGKPPEWRKERIFDEMVHALATPEEIAAAKEAQQSLQKLQAKLKNLEKHKKGNAEQIDQLEKELRQTKQAAPTLEFAFGVRDAEQIGPTHVRIRGQWDKLSDEIPRRGFLSAVEIAAPPIPEDQSGRLQLAKWITSPEHPLTARVFVNRVWKQLFGRGLVSTVDNFGSSGAEPTHPELLDYLAHRFVHHHSWSVKALIREIMNARVYQLSSIHDEGNYQLDPDNRLYWRSQPRRLDAESIRDAILLVGSQLDLKPRVRSSVADLKYAFLDPNHVKKIHASPQRKHRSVYLAVLRGQETDDLLAVFDFPDPGMVIGNRETTTVPSQSLVLMNSPLVLECAAACGARLAALKVDGNEEAQQAERINVAYQTVLNRRPTADERDQATSALAEFGGSRAERWTVFVHTLLLSTEFRYVY